MKEVVIVSAVRTAIGAFQSSLKDAPATTLGSSVMKAAIERASISADIVDEGNYEERTTGTLKREKML